MQWQAMLPCRMNCMLMNGRYESCFKCHTISIIDHKEFQNILTYYFLDAYLQLYECDQLKSINIAI